MTRLVFSLLLVTACVDETNLGNVLSDPPPPVTTFTPSVRWATSFGAPLQADTLNVVATDSLGDVVAVGTSFDPDLSGYISKRVASDGSERWTIRMSTQTGSTGFYGLAIDSDDNIIVTGSYGGTVDFGGQSLTSGNRTTTLDTFVAKYAPSGTLLWVRGISSSAISTGNTIAVDDTGTIYVAGTFKLGSITLAGQTYAPPTEVNERFAFLLALDPDGTDVWGRSFDAHIQNLAFATNGDLLVTGEFVVPTSLGGAVLVPAGHPDTFISRFRSDGWYYASRSLGLAGNAPLESIVQAEGSIVIRTWESIHGFERLRLVAIDDDLDDLWSVDATSTALTRAGSGTLGARMNLHWSSDPGATSTGTLNLTRVDADGVETTGSIGSLVEGSAGGTHLHEAATDSSGALVFAGEHTGTFDFGTGPVTGGSILRDEHDVVIVVLDPIPD